MKRAEAVVLIKRIILNGNRCISDVARDILNGNLCAAHRSMHIVEYDVSRSVIYFRGLCDPTAFEVFYCRKRRESCPDDADTEHEKRNGDTNNRHDLKPRK